MVSMKGLEPLQISPHAPQACASTIPPHRPTFFEEKVGKKAFNILVLRFSSSFLGYLVFIYFHICARVEPLVQPPFKTILNRFVRSP